jgi:hypothetical protein
MTILTLRPNSDVFKGWTSSPSGANYACVDEDPANDTDLIWTASRGGIARFGLPNHAAESGTINSVTIYARAKRTGSTRMALGVVMGGTDYFAADITPTTSFILYNKVWTTNPRTGTTWTWENIDTLVIAIKNVTGATTCSQMYVQVDYAVQYVITCGSGSFTLTGQSCDLFKKYAILAGSGEFVLTGTSIEFVYHLQYVLNCASGTFNLTGQSATLLKDSLLDLTSGSGHFDLHGSNVSLLKKSLILAGSGSFGLTGTNSNLLKSSLLSTASGAFSLSGTTLSLLKSSLLSAGSGQFYLSGFDVDLIYTILHHYVLTCGSGSFTLTGIPATLLASRLLSCGSGSFGLTGTSLSLLKDSLLAAGIGEFKLIGQTIVLSWSGYHFYLVTFRLDSPVHQNETLESLATPMLFAGSPTRVGKSNSLIDTNSGFKSIIDSLVEIERPIIIRLDSILTKTEKLESLATSILKTGSPARIGQVNSLIDKNSEVNSIILAETDT